MAKLTIKDIAKICGVGTSTVSRAINDDPGINPDTKKRILAVVKEYHFVPNNSARNLKVAESNTIGVLVKGRNNRFFQSMYADLENELEKRGYEFTLKELSWNESITMSAAEIIKEKRLKGIIIMGGLIEDPNRIKSMIDIPYVFCTVALNSKSLDYNLVAIDDEREGYHVTDYLIKRGHKKIAIIAGQKNDYAVGGMRLKGYKNALEANGIEYNPKLVGFQVENLPDYSEANGYEVMKELINSGEEFSAIFATSDLVAFGAYKAIYDAGKKIPDDYSIVGFDGIEITKYMYPSLTTLRQPVEKIIESTVNVLVDSIEGEGGFEHIMCETQLLERDSVKDISQK